MTQKPVASIGLGPLGVSPLEMAAAYATFAAGGIFARPMAITKVVLPNGKLDKAGGWGKPAAKRAVSEAVAWEVTEVLGDNARYGTGAGSGDGIHPTAGKTGTTENHADAWYVGYTRGLSTAVWMGYPSGEIPMESVHGQTVAGSTFAVPIWHLYMAAAEWNRPVREFVEPEQEVAWRPLEKHYYGYTYTPYSETDEEEDETETDKTATTPAADAPPAVEQTPKPQPAPSRPTAPSRPSPAMPRPAE
jgi:membrane peptidoglycan carboxypeptidase